MARRGHGRFLRGSIRRGRGGLGCVLRTHGAGVRLQLGGMGLFGQVQHHNPLDRSVGTIGVVF